jgi:hypothetical protein
VQQAYEKLLADFDVDAATLKHDLAKLIEQLLHHRLIALVAP